MQNEYDFILLHGTGGDNQCHWFPWLTQQLESEGKSVFCPNLPNSDDADIIEWSNYLLKHIKFTPQTTILGHSAGVPLILHLLNHGHACKRTILVGGFAQPLNGMSEDHQTLPKNITWHKVKENAGDVYILNSDNDPWGCDDAAGAYLRGKLGGRQIITTNEGHYGSEKFGQRYTEFPLLKSLCLLP